MGSTLDRKIRSSLFTAITKIEDTLGLRFRNIPKAIIDKDLKTIDFINQLIEKGIVLFRLENGLVCNDKKVINKIITRFKDPREIGVVVIQNLEDVTIKLFDKYNLQLGKKEIIMNDPQIIEINDSEFSLTLNSKDKILGVKYEKFGLLDSESINEFN